MESWAKRWDHWYLRALPAYLLFLFFSTHTPGLTLPGGVNSDKIAHVGAFGLLAFLLWRFCESLRRPVSTHFFVVAWITLTIIASGDEYTQQFFGRDTGWGDWVADMIGLTAVVGGLEWWRRRKLRASAPS